jgi:hypothetical protein
MKERTSTEAQEIHALADRVAALEDDVALLKHCLLAMRERDSRAAETAEPPTLARDADAAIAWMTRGTGARSAW